MDEWYKKGLIDYEYYLEQREDAFHNYEEALRESWEEEADNIEKALDYVAKKAQDEIDKLEDKKKEINDKYDKEIEALRKKNDETEKEIELQKKLEELAKAKQKRVLVYKNGKFQYVQDVDEIAKAQSQITEFQKQQELDKQIEALEANRDKELAILDEKIEYWDDYVEKYGNAIDKVKEEQDRLLAEQTLGIHLEGENWETRLDNLQTYVDRYIELMQKLENQKWETGFGEDLETGEGPGSESGSSGKFNVGDVGTAWVPGKGVIKVETVNGQTLTPLPVGSIVSTAGGDYIITGGTPGKYESDKLPDRSWVDKVTGPTSKPNYGIGTSPNVTEGTSKTVFSVNGKAPPGLNVGDRVVTGAGGTWEITKVNPDGSYESKKVSDKNKGDYGGKLARGALSAPGGMTLVGEEGPELRLLNHGDTIFPSHATKNLMALGQFDWTKIAQLGNSNGGNNNSDEGATYITIQNFNPNLPNVKDGEDFAVYMKNNFWQNVVQYQSKR